VAYLQILHASRKLKEVDAMKKGAICFIIIFFSSCLYQYSYAQGLAGTWLRSIAIQTECPSLPPQTQTITDTVTYTESDRTIELPEQYGSCVLQSQGNNWSLDCTYDQEMETCTYHFHVTGSGSLGESEFNFQFSASYTVSGGISCSFIPLCVTTGTIHGDRLQTTGIDGRQETANALHPGSYGLLPNYPNPFNMDTEIRYRISDIRFQMTDQASAVRTTLRIYNILGQEVTTLVDEVKGPGTYTSTWDGRDGAGREVSSGFYFFRLQAGRFNATRCMVLLK
jgi:hypothetical protein